MTTFATRDEAIDYIVECIESTDEVKDAYAEYDIPAIAEQVVGEYPDYEIAEDEDPEGVDIAAFWAVVEANAR